MVVDRKKQNEVPVLYLASGPLPNATSSSDVLTEFAAKHNINEVLEGKFRNLNFLPSTKRQLGIVLNFYFLFIDITYFFYNFEL